MKNLSDVKKWILDLQKDFAFHPDTDAAEYINAKGEPCFTPEQAEVFNEKLDKAFEICEEYDTDIYDLALSAYKIHEAGRNRVMSVGLNECKLEDLFFANNSLGEEEFSELIAFRKNQVSEFLLYPAKSIKTPKATESDSNIYDGALVQIKRLS